MSILSQCCGLTLLAIIVYFYSFRRKILIKTGQNYLELVFATVICTVFDMLSIFCINHEATLPQIFVEIVQYRGSRSVKIGDTGQRECEVEGVGRVIKGLELFFHIQRDLRNTRVLNTDVMHRIHSRLIRKLQAEVPGIARELNKFSRIRCTGSLIGIAFRSIFLFDDIFFPPVETGPRCSSQAY